MSAVDQPNRVAHREAELTDQVLRKQLSDPRGGGRVEDVRLTEPEWRHAIELLDATARSPIFGVKQSLIGDFLPQAPGEGPAGRTLEKTWWKLVFDMRLAREESE